MDTLVDAIEFRATAKRTPLPMLDESLAKLRAISAQIDLLQGKLSGLSTMSAFKRTKEEMADMLKSATPMTKRLPIKSVAEILGIPDVKDFQAFMSRWKSAHKEAAKSIFTGSGATEFASPAKAAEMARKYLTSAQSRAKDPVAQLQALLGGGSIPAPRLPAAPAPAPAIPLPTPIAPTAEIAPPKPAPKAKRRKSASAAAEGDEGEENPAAKAKAFRDGMASIHRDMMETIAEKNASGVAGTGDPERIAKAREKAADQIRSLVESSGLPEGGSATENALAKAAGLEKTAEDLRQKMMADSMKRVGKIREELASARERGDKEEEQRLNSERRQLEKRIKSQNRMINAGQKSQDKKDQAIQKGIEEAAARQTAIRDAAIRKATTHAAAQGALADFLAAGGQITSETSSRKAGPSGPQTSRTVHAQRDFGGRREMMTAHFDESGASVKKLTRNLSEARAEAGYLAGDFVKNTAKVTLWAASVGVLYKSLELATHSMTRVIEIAGQMARLDQVFRGVGGSTQQLTSEILHLAAVNGRSTQEAMDSAIQWSRLGLTRSQVNEAVRVSLMAANVAELSAADATEHLQAVMQNYQLQVGELRTVLGELNQISNTYNVTNAQMLDGISKTAAVAKQAGLPLSELMGLIGATVGATGQSGANIGNSIKTMITSLGNPDLQAKLRGQFGFEASTGGEGLKSMSELLSDLYVKYQHLNEQQQASLRFQVAGKFQATRLAALLDNYVRAQTLAINAQLNLNSAETENAKIKDTLKSQLTGLASEWERFVAIQGNRGPVQVLTQMSIAMRNLLTLMNTSVGSKATTGILGLLMAGGMKSVLTGMGIKEGSGFLSRSGNAVRGALGQLNQSMLATYAQFAGGGLATPLKRNKQGKFYGDKVDVLNNHGVSLLTARAGQQIGLIDALMQKSQKWLSSNNAIVQSLGGVTRALGTGLIALRSWLLPMAAMGVAVYTFNRGMEAIGLNSEKTEARLAGFNAQAEKSAAAANAFAEAASLMSTAQRSLNPEVGFRKMQPDDARKMLSQMSEVVGIYEPDPSKRNEIQAKYRAETEQLLAQGKILELNNLLEAERNRFLDARKKTLQETFESIQRQQKENEDRIASLKKDQKSWYGRIGYDTRAKEIAEQEKRKIELSGDITRNILEQTGADQQKLEYDQRHQDALEKHRLTLQSIEEIYQTIGTNNPYEKALVRMASLDAQLGAIKSRRAQLSKEYEGEIATDDQRQSAEKMFREQETAARNELASLNAISQQREQGWRGSLESSQSEFRYGMPSLFREKFGGEVSSNITRAQATEFLKEKTAAAEAAIKAATEGGEKARRGITPENQTRFTSIQQQQQKLLEEETKTKAQRDAEHSQLEMRQRQTQFQFGQEQSRRAVVPFGYGFDETNRLQRQRRALEADSKRLEAKPNLSLDEQARLLENQRQLYQTILALRERAYSVERDINQLVFDRAREMQRSLFDAGPNELLKKLAAFRTAFNGKGGLNNISAGAMMSFAPEFRRDVAGAQFSGIANGMKPNGPIFDAGMAELLQERQRVKFFKGEGMAKEWDRYQSEISGKIGALAERLSKVFDAPLTSFNAAAKVMDTFTNKVTDSVIPALDALAAKLNAVSVPTPAPAKGGQYGGRGGQAGYS